MILVFSLQNSGHFQGYAKLRGDKCESVEPLPEQGGNLNCLLPIEWVKRGNLTFNATRHLVNSYNENNKVQASRDGQVWVHFMCILQIFYLSTFLIQRFSVIMVLHSQSLTHCELLTSTGRTT